MEPTTSGLIDTNGVELWVETYGAAKDPAVVLISGADSPGAADAAPARGAAASFRQPANAMSASTVASIATRR